MLKKRKIGSSNIYKEIEIKGGKKQSLSVVHCLLVPFHTKRGGRPAIYRDLKKKARVVKPGEVNRSIEFAVLYFVLKMCRRQLNKNIRLQDAEAINSTEFRNGAATLGTFVGMTIQVALTSTSLHSSQEANFLLVSAPVGSQRT